MKNFIFIVLIMSFLSGCTSLNEVPLNEAALSKYVGEDVIITTHSGEVFEFTVEGATALDIYGDSINVKTTDIKEMEVVDFSPIKTVGLGASIAAFFGVVFAVIVAGS